MKDKKDNFKPILKNQIVKPIKIALQPIILFFFLRALCDVSLRVLCVTLLFPPPTNG